MARDEVTIQYAGALLEIGTETKTLDQLEEELGFVSALLSENRDIMHYFRSPAISRKSKLAFIDKELSGKLSATMINFLKIVIKNERMSSINDIHKTLMELLDGVYNRLRVTVITRSKLQESTLGKITDILKQKFNKTIVLDEKFDESIVGGIIFKIDDLVIDGSLATALKNLRDRLLKSEIRGEVAYEN